MGTLEERIKHLVTFLESKKNVVLFIDEIATIFHRGNHSNDSFSNIAEQLKPYIGNWTVIGGTTPRDLGLIPDLDTAFGRRFNKIMLLPPTSRECVMMLQSFMGSVNFKRVYPNFSLPPKVLEVIFFLTDLTINKLNPAAEAQPSVAIQFLDEFAQKNSQLTITTDHSVIAKAIATSFKEKYGLVPQELEEKIVEFINSE